MIALVTYFETQFAGFQAAAPNLLSVIVAELTAA